MLLIVPFRVELVDMTVRRVGFAEPSCSNVKIVR